MFISGQSPVTSKLAVMLACAEFRRPGAGAAPGGAVGRLALSRPSFVITPAFRMAFPRYAGIVGS